ncbi:uncharacterized protein TNIN_19291 [Trichonephila inaurata madagascariensis]|uniref:Uncharacterized protein n=1 Tax=Trichonephila inaurata madagascariensis TaxID=2747483 RepID=A0A8X6XJQ8_9ARAC|nr:uncharacterized protein TNIN_19291 [Trichonephila inaurata madagascariensis]
MAPHQSVVHTPLYESITPITGGQPLPPPPYPDNGARTTRGLLLLFILHIFYSLTNLTIGCIEQEIIFIYVACAFFGISGILLMVALVRILLFYLYRRRLEVSGVPLHPAEILTFANYLRILVFHTPKGYITETATTDNETQTEDIAL